MKIKHIVLATAAASALLASSSVFAIGASQGFYLGGQLGAAFNNLPTGNQTVGFIGTTPVTGNIKASEFAWGINGGYNYHIQSSPFLLGGQLGINGLGSDKVTANAPATGSVTVSYYALNLLGTATYVYQGFHVWAETGPSFAWTTASSGGFLNSESKMVWVLGAGAGYQWNKWDFFVRYDHYFGDSANSSNGKFPQINAVFGGVAYTF